MEPKQSSPNIGPEVPAVNYGQNTEYGSPFSQPERQVEVSPERHEQHQVSGTPLTAAVLPAPLTAPAPAASTSADDASAPISDDLPMVASDEDLIEKEWVDKAKKIITQTKDDPYRREQEVSKLQADYLKKRYGKELGSSL